MIRIITTKALTALRAEAALVPQPRPSAEQEGEARRQADAAALQAQTAQATAEDERNATQDDVTAGLARLEIAVSDPHSGHAVQAEIALRFLRGQIANVRASGDPAAIDGIRVLDMLIGDDHAPGRPAPEPRPPAQLTQQHKQETPIVSTPSAAGYHHPHFISAAQISGGTQYQFRPFTGTEAKPALPDAIRTDDSLTLQDRDYLSDEYCVATRLWEQARFRRTAIPMITAAVPLWESYGWARGAMDAEFAVFWETGDNRWRAQILRLTDAHDQALRAARDWDHAAAGLANLQYEHYRRLGEGHELQLRDVAAEAGTDITGWSIEFYYYDDGRSGYGTPLTDVVAEAISQQRRRLRDVGELAGQRRDEEPAR